MPIPTQLVKSLDLITGNETDNTGTDGIVRITRTATGIQASIDGAAPAPLAGGGSSGRFSTIADTMVQALPVLTDFNGNGPAVFPNGNPTGIFQSVDAKLPGGAVTAANTKFAAISNTVVFVDVASQSWAVGVYGRLATSTGGNTNVLGLVGATSMYGVGTFSTDDATHYLIYTFKAGGAAITEPSTLVCDDADHFFVVAYDADALNIKLFVDGADVATLTDLTNLHSADVYVGLYNDVQGDAIAFLGGVGFIAA